MVSLNLTGSASFSRAMSLLQEEKAAAAVLGGGAGPGGPPGKEEVKQAPPPLPSGARTWPPPPPPALRRDSHDEEGVPLLVDDGLLHRHGHLAGLSLLQVLLPQQHSVGPLGAGGGRAEGGEEVGWGAEPPPGKPPPPAPQGTHWGGGFPGVLQKTPQGCFGRRGLG